MWTAPDPLGFAAGDTALYRYVFNDPINLTDPSGELAFAPLLAGAYLTYRVASGALTLLDLYNAAQDLLDPCVSSGDKMKLMGEMLGDALAGFLLGKGLAAATKRAGKWIRKFLRGCRNSFVAGTLVAAADLAVPIEDVDVGDRVLTLQSEPSRPTAVDATWKVVRLVSLDEPRSDITLLRPPAWLEAHALAPGVRIELADEGGGTRWAKVVAIEPFDGPETGPGRVVTGAFTRVNADLYQVTFAETGAVLRGTGDHPLYALDRDAWVRVRDLQVGERLQTAEGAVTIEALEKVRGEHRVYNLEVQGDHEYLVGEARVRAHNRGPKISPQKQAGHVPGTPQNRLRKEQGKSTSEFFGEKSGEKATRMAHERGTPIPGRPQVKEHDFGVGVGTGPGGGVQTKVRVHTDKQGRIHGHPSGPEHF